MASPVFCNYRLYKTLPKLAGNMKLDLVVGMGNNGMAYVRQAHLRPIAGTSYIPITDERIMDRPHQNNIRKFYENTRGNFYNSNPPASLDSDWFMTVSPHEMRNLKYIKTWDDTFLAGCSRMPYKLYGTTHEILVPLWLDKCNGVKFRITFMAVGEDGSTRDITYRDLNLSEEYLYGNINGVPELYNKNEKFHNDFTKYLMDYFQYAKIMDGNASVLNIQFKQGISTISGLAVESGNLTTRLNYNIVQNLSYRERPLLEANSLLTNTFADYKMICSQLINFNICFDLEDMMHPQVVSNLLDGNSLAVKVDALALRERPDIDKFFTPKYDRTDLYKFYSKTSRRDTNVEYKWQGPLEVRDFYTNHEYVPRPKLKEDYGASSEAQYYEDGPEYLWNALNYKRDNESSEMMHKNKITQGICHWVYAQHPDGNLFNVYDGFGAYLISDGKEIVHDHGSGTITDPNIDKFDPSSDNTIWAGPPRIGDGADVENTLNAPDEWIENGYFKDATNFIGGLKFEPNYTPGGKTPKKVWIGTMTTPWDSNAESRKSAATSYMTSRHVIGILVERIGADGNTDLPPSRQLESSEFDRYYDWHYHSDIDNRFAIKKRKDGKTYYLYYHPKKIKLSKELQELLKTNPKEAWKLAEKQGIVWWEESEQATRPDDSEGRVRVGGLGEYNTSMRQHMNSTALYIATRRKHKGDHVNRPDDEMCMILWHPRARKPKKEVVTSNNILFGNLWPHGLTVGGFTSAVKDYCNKYRPCITAIELSKGDPDVDNIDFPSNLPNMGEMEEVLGVAKSLIQPEVIWFDRTIYTTPDYTLSRNAKEIKYYKDDAANSYVLRYSGNIKPAMFPEKTVRRVLGGKSSQLSYKTTYGRNFIYSKHKIFPSLDMSESQKLFIGVGVPPVYPSLGFDSISPIIRTPAKGVDNECKACPHGDVLYQEPLPLFFGLTNSGTPLEQENPYKKYYLGSTDFMGSDRGIAYQTYKWYEYKWYDQSRLVDLPKKLKYTIKVPRNDEDTLELAAHAAMSWPVSRSELQTGVTETPGTERFFEVGSNTPLRNQYIVHDGPRISPINLKGMKYVLDSPYLRNTYDLEFNLQSAKARTDEHGEYIRDSFTGQVLYEYTYDVIATLK